MPLNGDYYISYLTNNRFLVINRTGELNFSRLISKLKANINKATSISVIKDFPLQFFLHP